ncbi:MAG: nucleotide sugar dehydrogenase, partial [Phycisphaerae bacterium]|nr:nucleotide sugar dehydrogenase [Phycisphaerae bacterium]
MNAYDELLRTIDRGEAVVGVIGLGYVGLPLAAAFHDAPSAARRIVGFDSDPKKIERLSRGEMYLKHLGDSLPKRLAAGGRFDATCDLTRIAECDAVLVCVPTPLNARNEPDLSYVLRTAESIGRVLRAGQLIVLESTTYPGTTRDEFVPAIMRAADPARGLRPGEDWFAAFSPERENPGDPAHSTHTIPKLVGGLDERSTALASRLYGRAVRHVVGVRS